MNFKRGQNIHKALTIGNFGMYKKNDKIKLLFDFVVYWPTGFASNKSNGVFMPKYKSLELNQTNIVHCESKNTILYCVNNTLSFNIKKGSRFGYDLTTYLIEYPHAYKRV